MINSFNQWEKGEGGSNASLVELKALKQLTTLEINIRDVKIVPQDLVSVELERFKIFLGDEWEEVYWYKKGKASRTLKLDGLDKNIYLGEGMKILLKRAEDLRLKRLNSLENVFHEFSSCQNLTKMEVLDCESMECVISTHGLRSDEEQIIEVMAVSKLKSLKLSKLPILTTFLSGSSFDTSSDTDEQSLFDDKVTFPNLETLKLSELNIEKIWLDQFSTCQNLTKLKVNDCNHLKFLLSYSMFCSLGKLQDLEIRGCESMECVIDTNGLRRDEEQITEGMEFSKLKDLELSSLPTLRGFLSMGSSQTDMQSFFDDKVIFPTLETLTLSGLNIERIWPHQVSTCQNLRTLEVRACRHLKFPFDEKVTFPGLETMYLSELKIKKIWIHQFSTRQNLRSLEVWNCNHLKFLFDEKDAFPALETLGLLSLNIEKICLHQFSTCQNLTKLEVRRCHHLKFLISYSMVHSLGQLQNLVITGCKSMECVININRLRRDEGQNIGVMTFPKLKRLTLSCLSILTRFLSVSSSDTDKQSLFDDKVAFPNLKTLEVIKCHGLRNLVTLSAVENLVNLERIEINYCKMIEEIVQQIEEVKADPITFSQLVYLKLHQLQRLKHFFGGSYTLEFPYLEKMIVSGCLSMNIFSKGVLRTPKLQKLQLTDKYRGENEEQWEGSLNSTIQKMFEKMDGLLGLENLILSEVPRVKEIWHNQTLPIRLFDNLWSLVVDDCNLMSSAIPTNLLQFVKNLETLKVMNCDYVEEVFRMEELNVDEHFVKLFPKLRSMDLIDLPKLKRFCNFSQSRIELSSLHDLNIENCPNIETFISNSTHDQSLFNEKVAFQNLEVLKLSNLPKLLHLCKENSLPIDAFQNLTTLKISKCTKLEVIVPSWVSFQNLIKIKISKCDGLINLMALSTTESMMKLRKIKVSDCKMIEEIIHVREEAKKDCIVFSNLEYLELNCLSSLTGFFLGNYTLEFPCLEKVIVKECPKMEIFSWGVLSTPKLKGLLTEIKEEEYVEEDEWLWEGNLNSTVQKLFGEMNKRSSKDEDWGN